MTTSNDTSNQNAEKFRKILSDSLDGKDINAGLSDEAKEKIRKAHEMLELIDQKYRSLKAAKEEGKTTKAWLIDEVDSLKKTGENGEQIALSDTEKNVVSEAIIEVLEQRLDNTLEIVEESEPKGE